jgi:hypothetical protein
MVHRLAPSPGWWLGRFTERRLIRLPGSSSVFSPKNGYLAYKKIAIWQRHLLHPNHTLLLNRSIRKKKQMIKISIEVRSSAARFSR